MSNGTAGILHSSLGETRETEFGKHQPPAPCGPEGTAQRRGQEMACTGQHTIPTNRTATFAVKRFASADGARLSSSPWTAGPPSPQDGRPTGRDGSAQLGDHYFDPLCGLICLPVWAAPDGRSTDERRRDAGVQYSEARNQISRLCALRRFVLEKLGVEVEGGPMTPHMRGSGQRAVDRLWPSMSDEYCNTIIEAEYDEISSPGGDGLSGLCLGCGSARPTLAILAPDNGCRHLVYCDSCASRYIVPGQDGGATSVPAHLWAAQTLVSCPICRKQGRLLRVWRPEEAGGWNGRCLHCNIREASVMVLRCRHLSCCQACKRELTVTMHDDGQRVVRCPVCSTEGVACNVFLP